jgi:hypothetical protein
MALQFDDLPPEAAKAIRLAEGSTNSLWNSSLTFIATLGRISELRLCRR